MRAGADWPAATAAAPLCVRQFGNTALMVASNQGDFLKVKNLCEQKADVNKQDKVRQTDQGAAGHGFLQRWSHPRVQRTRWSEERSLAHSHRPSALLLALHLFSSCAPAERSTGRRRWCSRRSPDTKMSLRFCCATRHSQTFRRRCVREARRRRAVAVGDQP